MIEQQPLNQSQAVAMRNDEIGLAELVSKIWRRKWWVLACTLLSATSAFVYVELAKPMYKAEIFFMPPSLSNLEELNQAVFLRPVGNSSLGETVQVGETTQVIGRDYAFRLFLNQLQSKSALKKFMGSTRVALKLKIPKRGEIVFVSATFRGRDASIVAMLNAYVESVQRNAEELLANDRRAQLKSMIRDTELMIAVKGESQVENLTVKPTLTELKERLMYLEKITVSTEKISTVTIDQAASTPRELVKTNKRLVLIAGIVLGCMLGLFIALAVPRLASRR